jgi:hypothetical protein
MLLNIIIGSSVFLLTNFCLLYTSHLVVRRFFPHTAPPVRLVAIGTLFYSFIIVIFQALSPFHAISRTWVTITCLVIATVVHLLWGRHRNLKADIEPIGKWLRDGLSSKWSVLIIICGFVVLLSFFRALLMPPLAWDCLTYHLTFATLWVKKGTLLLFKAPDQIQGAAHFPINGELFAAWLLLPFSTDLLVNIMNFPITFLGGIASYSIARELGLTRKQASIVPVLICFTPVIYSQITTEFLDNSIFAFSTISILFALRYLKKGDIRDGLFSSIPAGILLGVKFTGIPVVGLICITIVLKTISLKSYSGLSKKLGFVMLCLLILCVLGGRKYIFNSIDARNPVYPFPLKILNYEVFSGSQTLDKEKEWMAEHEARNDWDKFSLWEMEYRKFLYIQYTAGPKVFLFLILAVVSLFARPKDVCKRDWYFLSSMWIIPLFIHYSDSSANIATMGLWADLSTRYISTYIALFTIQGVVTLRKFFPYSKKVDIFLMVTIAWDLMQINKRHLQEIEMLYPIIIVAAFIVLIIIQLSRKKLRTPPIKEEGTLISTRPSSINAVNTKRLGIVLLVFIMLIAGLNLLQVYRNSTRYVYYNGHFDLTNFPRNLVDSWEFLDQPEEKKTIAMTMDYRPPSHNWFFYPLFGKAFQNDIAYISAKYKWNVPAWLEQGLLRGDDYEIWLFNLKRKRVNYVLLVEPWPVELNWISQNKEDFQLVFSGKGAKIFRYLGQL